MSKKILIRVGVAIIIVAIVVLAVARKKGLIGEEDALKVTTEKAMLRSIIETVSANGKIQPEVDRKSVV